jgi:uncharacterized protein (UPF0128 family)
MIYWYKLSIILQKMPRSKRLLAMLELLQNKLSYFPFQKRVSQHAFSLYKKSQKPLDQFKTRRLTNILLNRQNVKVLMIIFLLIHPDVLALSLSFSDMNLFGSNRKQFNKFLHNFAKNQIFCVFYLVSNS